jgi:hypothetical protein
MLRRDPMPPASGTSLTYGEAARTSNHQNPNH